MTYLKDLIKPDWEKIGKNHQYRIAKTLNEKGIQINKGGKKWYQKNRFGILWI